MEMGEMIRQHRLRLRLSQEALGAKVGVKRAAVQKWECGAVQNMKAGVIKRLSDVFGITPVELMCLSNKKSPPLPEPSKKAQSLLQAFERLNPAGQSEAVKRVSELSELSRYVN